MKQVKKIVLLSVLSILVVAAAQAAIEVYHFDDVEKTNRFKQLTAELRCPKCQNQNIADSNAEIAQDLRAKLQQMLEADKNDDEIVQYMIDRYGDFVLYKPRVDPQTYLLWFGPIFLLLVAFFVVYAIVRVRTKRSSNQLNTDQQEKLNNLLNKKQD